MTITIPIKTTADLKGFKDIEAAAIKATKTQIAEHRKVASLTKKLDQDMARERQSRDAAFNKGAVVAGVALAAGAAFYLESAAAAREAAAAEAELDAALKSTGQASAEYKGQLAALAEEQQRLTNFTDEQIQHAESLLLTYDKIGRDVMPRAVAAVADLAELLDGDIQGASTQVGKALQGQLTALTKSGISFTEGQKEQIKTLFETNRAAEAQAIIMGELEKQVGGQAEAARRAAGGIGDLKVAYGELQEAVGGFGKAGEEGLGPIDVAAKIGAAGLDRLTVSLQGANAVLAITAKLAGGINLGDNVFDAGITGARSFADALGNINPLFGLMTNSALDALETAKAGQEEAAGATKTHTEALEDNTAATEDNAKAADELARSLEAANQARRDVAGALIDITEQAATDSTATWGQFFEDEQAAWKDHSGAIDKINADSEKQRIQNEKQLAKDLFNVGADLAKDLAKVDKELAKDKAKLDRDTNKQISRLQQDAAREEKQQRRARQIDARGDQRLFDFDMRQLAAEGSANAIQEAMGRRAIEKGIEAEKLEEEQTAKDESSRIEIDRIRQDAEERKTEMENEAQARRDELATAAEERRAQLNEQAAAEEAMRQEELAQALLDEQTSYDERMDAMRVARDEKLAQIEETKNAAIAKLAEEQTQNKELTREGMEATKEIAAKFGPEIGRIYAEGMNEGFARNLRIADIAGSELSGGLSDTGRPSSRPGAQNRGFARGGAFTVQGRGGTDSEMVSFLATPGETVSIATPGQQGGGLTIQQSFTVNGPGGAELAAFVGKRSKQAAEAAVEEYHSSFIVPWSQGQ